MLAFTDEIRLDPPAADHVLVHASIGPAGDLVTLWCAAADEAVLVRIRDSEPEFGPDRADRPGSRTVRPVDTTVVIRAESGAVSSTIRIPALELTYPSAQPSHDGTVLVVGRECSLRSAGPELNAICVSASGAVVGQGTLGGGINMVQTTPTGLTWVGYGDAGVYGTRGWGDPYRPGPDGEPVPPIGAWGLVRFGKDHSVEWEFGRALYEAELAGAEIDRRVIVDVYALNVIGETAWLYFYDDFAIARVHQDQIDVWDTDVHGATVLVSDGDRHMLVGGYGREYDRIVVGRLDAGALHRESTHRLVLPEGARLPPSARLLGRGSTVHAIVGNRWLRLQP